jgi:4-hydroxy-tetrahydrodipicolinate synthase
MDDLACMAGVFNITPTPFHPDGSLDLPSVATLTRFLIDRGVHGLTILGVLGEADKVSDEERAQVTAAVLEAADGRLPVCVGCTHASTDRAVAFARLAERQGARAVMLAPPTLARATDAALRRHYLSVAEAVTIPIVVQDHPASSGVLMSVDLLAGLADEAPGCRFVKLEDEPSPPKIVRLLAANPRVRIFGGLGAIMCLEELRHGATGLMTGFAFPEVLVAIYGRHARGDADGAAELFYRYCPLIRFETQPRINLQLRKHVYQRRGAIASPHARAPAAEIDACTLDDLDDLLTRLELGEVVTGEIRIDG